MLVITRKVGEKIVIDKNITITVDEVHGEGRFKQVELLIDIPRNIPVGRLEKFKPRGKPNP